MTMLLGTSIPADSSIIQPIAEDIFCHKKKELLVYTDCRNKLGKLVTPALTFVYLYYYIYKQCHNNIHINFVYCYSSSDT